MPRALPTPGLAALLLFALADLCTTLYWSSAGMMKELNPLMRPLLETNPTVFAIAKLTTLALLWAAVVWHYQGREVFCRRITAWGAVAYVALWCSWTAAGNL